MRERAVNKHGMGPWTRSLMISLLGTALALGAPVSSVSAQEAVDARIQALERQMEEMRRTMQSMEAELEALRKAPPPEVVAAPRRCRRRSSRRSCATSLPAETITTTEEATEPVVSSSQPKIKVSLSGQVEPGDQLRRMTATAPRPTSSTTTSRTRDSGLLGLANYNEDVRFGGLLEVAFSPNNSSDVSQDNEDAGDLIDVRRAETGVDSKRFGRLWLGEGSAATDNVAEYDLSGIDVIMYAGVADIVGGLQFTDEDGDLTGLTVADAFFDFDGDRQNRVRYDTPVFGPGLQFSTSAGADQRYDASLNWGGDFDQWSGVEVGPFTTLAAIGISDPSENGVDYRLMGSGSILHNPTGLNLTVSSGMDQADEGDPYNLYGKLGWYGDAQHPRQYGLWRRLHAWQRRFGARRYGYSVGGAVVQTIEGYGTELYSQVRWYTLDRDDRRASTTSWSARSARG